LPVQRQGKGVRGNRRPPFPPPDPLPPTPSPPPPRPPYIAPEAEAEEGGLPPSLLLILWLATLALCVPCSLGAICLFGYFVGPKIRDRLRSAAESASQGKNDKDGENDEANEDDHKVESSADTIAAFLDPAYLQGMDDSPDLEINPVIKYRVDEDKRAAVRAAQEAAESGADGGTNNLRGVPGAIARLGWSLDGNGKNGGDSKEELKNKENRRVMKNIEGFIARAYEADVSYESAGHNTLAGGAKYNALEMARKTELDRIGGRRETALIVVAQKSRVQLANYMLANPNGAGHCGVNPSSSAGPLLDPGAT